MQRESVLRSLLVATCLCIVCSVLVSSAAVVLKPLQEANKLRQMQKDVLIGGRTLSRRQSGLRAVRAGGDRRWSTWRRASMWIRSPLDAEAYDAKVASKGSGA